MSTDLRYLSQRYVCQISSRLEYAKQSDQGQTCHTEYYRFSPKDHLLSTPCRQSSSAKTFVTPQIYLEKYCSVSVATKFERKVCTGISVRSGKCLWIVTVSFVFCQSSCTLKMRIKVILLECQFSSSAIGANCGHCITMLIVSRRINDLKFCNYFQPF